MNFLPQKVHALVISRPIFVHAAPNDSAVNDYHKDTSNLYTRDYVYNSTVVGFWGGVISTLSIGGLIYWFINK